jgi:oligosaccharide repeat unit polymerase
MSGTISHNAPPGFATGKSTRSQPSKWSAWLWFITIVLTFVVGYANAGFKTALLTSAAMLASAILQRITGSPFRVRRITIGSFWFISYLVMIFFPAFFVYYNEPGPFRDSFLFSASSALITVPLGFVVANQLVNFHRSETETYFSRPLESNVDPSGVLLSFSLLLALCLILTVVYIHEVNVIPIFYLMRHPGEWFTLALLREESFKLLRSSLSYIFFMIRGLLFPFLIVLSFGYYLRTHGKLWLFAFLISLMAGVFFASLSIAKAPVAAIFVILVLFLYYYRGGSFGYKSFLVGMLLIFAFPVFVIVSISGSDTAPGIVLQAIFYRLTYGPSEVVYFYHEIFPVHMAYLHGGSIHMLSSLAGLRFVDTPNLVAQYAMPNGIESASFNGAFISDMHADFGLAGVLIGGILTGIIIQGLHIYIVRRRKTVAAVATYCLLVYAFWFLNSSSLAIVLASGGAIPAIFLWRLFDGRSWPGWFSKRTNRFFSVHVHD